MRSSHLERRRVQDFKLVLLFGSTDRSIAIHGCILRADLGSRFSKGGVCKVSCGSGVLRRAIDTCTGLWPIFNWDFGWRI